MQYMYTFVHVFEALIRITQNKSAATALNFKTLTKVYMPQADESFGCTSLAAFFERNFIDIKYVYGSVLSVAYTQWRLAILFVYEIINIQKIIKIFSKYSEHY